MQPAKDDAARDHGSGRIWQQRKDLPQSSNQGKAITHQFICGSKVRLASSITHRFRTELAGARAGFVEGGQKLSGKGGGTFPTAQYKTSVSLELNWREFTFSHWAVSCIQA